MKRAARAPMVRWAGIVLGAVVCAGATAAYLTLGTMPVGSLPVQFRIEAGSTLRGAARQMAQAGVLSRPHWFELLARLRGDSARLKAGTYEIETPVSPLALLLKVTQGEYTLASITLIEGWTFRQVRKALADHAALRAETRELSEAEILKRLDLRESSAEGLFFPDTYFFSHGSSDLQILRRAHSLMAKHLAAQWEGRAEGLPLASPYEALILASIVEKETAKPEERPLVAAVFINRLRRGMKLQTDPAVIYGLGDSFDGNLRRADLLADTPWNTYTRAGLPPTPIAMPGLASLAAVLNPAHTDALYFVSRGDGSHHFSRTLGEHERAVTKYQRSGRR